MQRRSVHVFSDRFRLDGDLYLPDGPVDRPLPAVVSASGCTGFKDIHPARFARVLTPHGYACLAFDYRGHGYSEGERGRLAPQEQVEDVRSAVSFMAALPEIDGERVLYSDGLSAEGWCLPSRLTTLAWPPSSPATPSVTEAFSAVSTR